MWNAGSERGSSLSRRFFAFMSAVSLVLFVATVVLWVRSYFTYDLLIRSLDVRSPSGTTTATTLVIDSLDGCFSVEWFRYEDLEDAPAAWRRVRWDALSRPPAREDRFNRMLMFSGGLSSGRFGYGYFKGTSVPQRRVATPHGAIALATFLLPGIRLWKGHRIRAWVRSGRCPSCGYDLRASRDRCPECGMPVPKKMEAAA